MEDLNVMTVSFPLPVMPKDRHGAKASLHHVCTMQSLLMCMATEPHCNCCMDQLYFKGSKNR